MKYLVTGGAGFIGSHLVEKLLDSGHEVIVVDDLSTGKEENLKDNIKCTKHFIPIQQIALDDIKGVDGIFHLAAQASVPISIDNFYHSSENNILGSLMVFDSARKLDIPVVYASSSAIYGELPEGDDNSDTIDLSSPYAADKYNMEKYAIVAHNLYRVPSIGLRFFNIYGPRQDPHNPYSGVISIFIKNVLSGESVTVNGGYQKRDFVYVKDAVEIVKKSMRIISEKNVCETVNICTGRSVTIDWLLESIVKIIGRKPRIEYKSLPPGDPENSLGTYDKMKKLYDLSLSDFIELEEGLKETIHYFQGNNV